MKKLFKIVGVFAIVFLLVSCEKPIEEPEIVEYTISFVLPEGIEALDDIQVESGKTIDLPELTDIGEYQWYEDQNYVILFDEEQLIVQDMTLYLKGQSYDSFTYYMRGSAYIYNVYEVKSNVYDANIITHPTPEKEGYTFSGWYLDKDFLVPIEEIQFVTDTSTQDISLYGKYEINTYQITFMFNGDNYLEYEIEYDELILISRPEVKNGQTFSGWYLDEALSIRFTELYMPNEDVVLYATLAITDEFESYTTIQTIKNNADLYSSTVIEFTGIVTATYNGNIFLTDGVEALVFYSDEIHEIGDKVRVVGTYLPMKVGIAIINVIDKEVIEKGLENPLDVSESTIKNLIDNYSANIDQLGQKFIISGKLQFVDGSYMGIYDELGNYLDLELENLNDSFEFRNYADNTVTMEVIFLGYSYKGINVAYKGLLEDIIIIEDKDDQLSLSEDILWIREFITIGVYYKVNIPSYAFNGSKVSNIEWSHPQYFSTYNYFIEEPDNGFNFTLSLTLTKGDYSEDIELSFIYVESKTIIELLTIDDVIHVETHGYIYAITDEGFYLHNAYIDGFIYVDSGSLLKDFADGDPVAIYGSWNDHVLYAYDIIILEHTDWDYYYLKQKTIEQLIETKEDSGTRVLTVAYIEYDEITDEIHLKNDENDELYLVVKTQESIDELMIYDGQYLNITIFIHMDDEVLLKSINAVVVK